MKIKPWKTHAAARAKAQEVGGKVKAIDHRASGEAGGYVVIGDMTDSGSAVFHRGGLEYALDLSYADRIRIEIP